MELSEALEFLSKTKNTTSVAITIGRTGRAQSTVVGAGYMDGKGLCVAMTAKGLVALSKPKRHPADLVLYGNDFEFRIPLENAGKYKVKQGVLNLAGLIYTDAIAVYSFGFLAIHALSEAGKDMKMDGHFKVLGCSPITLIMF